MGWASRYIQKLRAGETVSFRPHGRSMTGRIESRTASTRALSPRDPSAPPSPDFQVNGTRGGPRVLLTRRLTPARRESIRGDARTRRHHSDETAARHPGWSKIAAIHALPIDEL
jgi:hypothetical protein